VIDGYISFPNFEDAKCKEGDPNFFFPESAKELEERLPTLESICNSCRHKIDCADFAVDNAISWGFWGGFSSDSLKTMINKAGTNYDHRYRRIHETLSMREMGWSDEEIARSQHITVNSLLKQLQRAKEKGYIS
jgi:hypothetical protein